ncbi:MAG: uroporphyrinogen-III synthase [Fibrobacter sp.]|jgi:uroporphyrinogen-III synthase|nr:uroporphyrinogen-III synthase [Fibrobacter sp.]
MTVIDTRMDAPSSEEAEREKNLGICLVHLPALEMIPLETPVCLSSFDTAFVASPRAARLAQESLKKWGRNVWAVGSATAAILRNSGVKVSEEGNAEGALLFFEQIAKTHREFPAKKIAWLSALETEVSLEFLREKYGAEIVHFPLYETLFRKPSVEEIENLPHPRKWRFYSGKGVESLFSYIAAADEVELVGKSAEKMMNKLKGNA